MAGQELVEQGVHLEPLEKLVCVQRVLGVIQPHHQAEARPLAGARAAATVTAAAPVAVVPRTATPP